MKCPNCRADNNIGVDSRNNNEGGQKRIRQCMACGARFKTKETLYTKARVTHKPLPACYANQIGKEIRISESRNTI